MWTNVCHYEKTFVPRGELMCINVYCVQFCTNNNPRAPMCASLMLIVNECAQNQCAATTTALVMPPTRLLVQLVQVDLCWRDFTLNSTRKLSMARFMQEFFSLINQYCCGFQVPEANFPSIMFELICSQLVEEHVCTQSELRTLLPEHLASI